jgi:hypothetical protein
MQLLNANRLSLTSRIVQKKARIEFYTELLQYSIYKYIIHII